MLDGAYSRTPARGKTQKGAAIVESALVFLTLLGMIIFIMDMGRMLLMQQYITERVRSTARQASVNNWTAVQVQNYVVYNSITAPNGGGPGYLGLLTSQVSYTTLNTAGTPDYSVQVQVSGVPVFTWIPYVSGKYTAPPISATMPAQSLGAIN